MPYELLVVEDSDDDYDAFARTCRTVGFEGDLRRFDDAENALDYLRGLNLRSPGDTDLPGLIVLDLNLPGMDGRDFLEILKSDQELRQLPVVVFTTSSNEGDVAYCYKHYVNGYHLKAMDMERFEAEVRLLLDYWFRCVVSPLKPSS